MSDHERWKIIKVSVPASNTPQRIIACVNACKGLPNIEIQGAIDQGGFIEVLNRMAADIAELKQASVLNVLRAENKQLAAEIESLRKQLHRL